MASIFGRSVIVPLTNKSGGGVVLGDVVVVDTTTDESFTTTTSAASTSAIGVAAETIANNAVGRIIVGGYASLVNVNASVTRNQFGTTHTVAKQAVASASRVAGTFCRWLKTSATPSAYIYPVDLAGTALTNPMTTAEDIIVGGASGTPARLAKGAAGGALSIINAAVAWNSGTSFPGSKATGDRYWRTDEGLEYYWDGTRWVTTTLYQLQFGNQQAVAPWAATTALRTSYPHPTKDIYGVDFYAATFVQTTNNGTAFWTIGLDGSVTLSTVSNTPTTVVVETASINSVLSNGAAAWLTVTITKVLSPGTLFADPRLTYRLIGT